MDPTRHNTTGLVQRETSPDLIMMAYRYLPLRPDDISSAGFLGSFNLDFVAFVDVKSFQKFGPGTSYME